MKLHVLMAAAIGTLAGCEGCNELPTRQEVTPTAATLTYDGEVVVGGYGEELDVADETGAEPRGDFYVARVRPDGTTVADSWVGTPQPERLRGVSATIDGSMLAYGAALTSVCDDSAWLQRGALVELSAAGTIGRAVTLSRVTTTAIADCEFAEQFHLSEARKSPDRTVVVGDWSGFDEAPSPEGITVASFDTELGWAIRLDDRGVFADFAIVGEETYVAVQVDGGTLLTRLDAAGVGQWTIELPWTVTAMTARTIGPDVAGFCESGEVCVARISSEGEVVSSRRIDQLEAETVSLASETTIAAWDGTKIFFIGFDENLGIEEASFVEAGAAPMGVDDDKVAWVIDGEVQAWRATAACGRERFVIEELASSDAELDVTTADSPWIDEELLLESWEIVAQPRGYPLPAEICL